MKLHHLSGPALLAALIAIPFGSAPAAEKPASNFSLVDGAGKRWTLHEQKVRAIVVAFLATECPMSNGYLPTLADVATKYAERGVTVLGIVPDPDVTAAQLAAHAKEYKLPFPTCGDGAQTAVGSLGARVTPEVVVLDEKFVVRYRGRIDDGYTARLKQKVAVTRHDLTEALDEILAGKPVTVPETRAFGCPLPLPDKKTVATAAPITFYKDVLPVLQAHCQSCHRPGQVGPFELTSYKQAAKWADLCLEEVKAKRMPPWKPAPNPLLAGDRSLPADARKVLEQWVALGLPEGDPKDAPASPRFSDDWILGEPDLILEDAADTTIAASGPDHFRVHVLQTNFPEDRYVVAMEVKPRNPRVVHHTVQIIDTTGVARKRQIEAEASQKLDDPDRGPGYSVSMGFGFLPNPAGMLGGWAPGLLPKRLPEGVGHRLPKGADVCVHVHYHRTGKVETERTRFGFYFSRKPVTDTFHVIPVAGLFWSIPAGAKNYKVDSSWRLTDDATVYRLIPHMHYIGKDVELLATPPGGKETSIIRIPVWDYNWQEQYDLKVPLKMSKGTILRIRGTYDNSADNPGNPSSPPRPVMLGEHTTNEMCFVFMGVTSISTMPRVLVPIFGR